jgi:hypothetical protein
MPLYTPGPYDDAMWARVADEEVQYSFRVFNDLVGDLEEFCRYVPPEAEHLRVFSTKLWGIIIRACAEVDSQLNALLDDMPKPVPGKRTIRSYIRHEPDLQLSAFTLVLRTGSISLTPFQAFGTFPALVPDWWTDYNAIKHRRLESLRRATLGSALHAVGGLFVVLYRQWGEYWVPRPMTLVAGQQMAKSSSFFVLQRTPWS